MQLFRSSSARRLGGLLFLLFVSLPFGFSVVGCGHKAAAPQYCNDQGGLQVGQLYSISLSPQLAVTGESVNYGQIGTSLGATGYDCKGNTVALTGEVFGTTNMALADVKPTDGTVCGGTWNRNSGGGVADYTICNPPTATATNNGSTYLAYLTVTASGITSNVVPVYVHPTVTSISFGRTGGCGSSDPDTACFPANSGTTTTATSIYDGQSCISQNHTAQVTARIYSGSTNITQQSGHVIYGTQGASGILSLDPNGVATAEQPGSVALTAQLSNSSNASSIGFFSTCPPASITLSAVGQGTSNNINVGLNNTQPLTATAVDTNGNPLTGLALEFESTTPQTITASSTGAVVPVYPGSATITAVCQPPSCNPAPYSQIGYLGNGKPVTSSGIQITATGTSSTVLFAGSTNSQYIYPIDFSTGQPGALVKLPFVPNSMVITQDGSTIYLGSSQALMSVSTFSNAVTVVSTAITGTVISVSPDGGTVVVTDPARKTISLVSGTTVESSYGGVATRAAWSPDSQTVYVTTDATQQNGNIVLTHSGFTNWQATTIAPPSADTSYNDVTVMVPAVGAYFAGASSTDGRSYCSTTTIASASPAPGAPPTTANVFTPLADVKTVATERVAATTDGKHILGASSTAGVSDLFLTSTPGVCTLFDPTTKVPPAVSFASTIAATSPFAGISVQPGGITGVVPASNSALAFVTFNGTGGKIPYYVPNSNGSAGTLSYVTLATTSAGTPVAPITGVFSTDNFTFYVGTTGDNLIHLISVSYPASGTPAAVDSSQIAPKLPDANGNIVAPNLIVQKPRRVTS